MPTSEGSGNAHDHAMVSASADPAQLRLLLENVGDVIIQLAPDRTVLWASPSLADVLGYDPIAVIGEELPVDGPDQLSAVDYIFERATADPRGSIRHRTQVQAADGSMRWVDARVRLIDNADGTLASVVASIRDVTSEVETAEALADTSRRFQLLAENAIDAVIFTDPERTVTWASPSIEAALGWSAAELVGQRMSELIHPDDDEENRTLQRGFYVDDPDTANSQEFTVRIRSREGAYRWMSGKATRIFEDGAFVGVVSGLRDVEELVSTREELARDRGWLAAIDESGFDPHIVVEPTFAADGTITDFRHLRVNEAALRALDIPRETLLGSPIAALFPPNIVRTLVETYTEAWGSPEPVHREDLSIRNDDGETLWLDLRAVRVGDSLSVAWRDVTARHEAAVALAASERHYRLLSENLSDVVVRVKDGRIVWVSGSVTSALGWKPPDWLGHRIEDFADPRDLGRVMKARAKVRAGGESTQRLRVGTPQGGFRWVETTARPFFDDAGKHDGSVVSLRVVDDQVAAEKKLKKQARYDHLTGMLNRPEGLNRLGKVLSQTPRTGAEVAVVFCDLDGFKEVNDTYGHHIGDLVLRTVASRLRGLIRGDDLVARLGGDEILVVFNGVHSLAAAVELAGRMLLTLNEPVVTEGAEIIPAVSMGVTLVDRGEDLDTVINRADAAMYEAKRAGGNRVATLPPSVSD